MTTSAWTARGNRGFYIIGDASEPSTKELRDTRAVW